MLTSTTSRKAAPMRSQNPALGKASTSGRGTAIAGGLPAGDPRFSGVPIGALKDGSVLEEAIAGAAAVGGGGAGFSGISRRRVTKVAVTAPPKPQRLTTPT